MSDFTTALWVRISNALYRENGQAMTEYALVIGLIAVIGGAVIAGSTGIGGTIINKITAELGKVAP